ncbi:MAG TPA: hypothetical protein VF400_13445, partial [Anaeromyxobacteraceae bacterium]
LEFTVPPGGMAIWCRVAEQVDVERWAEASARRGVPFDTGRVFAFDGAPRPALRLGFAAEAENEIREGVQRMAAALPRGRARAGAAAPERTSPKAPALPR